MDAADYAIGLAKKDNAKLICFTASQLPSFYGWSATEPPKEWQEKVRVEMQQQTEKIKKLQRIMYKQKQGLLKALCPQKDVVDYAERENVV